MRNKIKKTLRYLELLALALLICSNAPAVSHAQEDSPFGMGGCLPSFAEEVEDAGIGIVRVWINWSTIQPEKLQYAPPNKWNWTDKMDNMDAVVQEANDKGMEVLGMFRAMPDWAKGCDHEPCLFDPCTPKDWKDFRNFAKAVAERYDGDGDADAPPSPVTGRPLVMRYIEIFNEVQGFAHMNSTEYAPWLREGYLAVKQGNQNAKVLLGAVHYPEDFPEAEDIMGQSVEDFINAMLTRENQKYYDIFSFHIYQKDDSEVKAAIDYMRGLGVTKPIWITETATFISLVPCNDLAWRDDMARGVVKRYTQALANDVEKVFWFAFVKLPTVEETSAGLACEVGSDFNLGGLGWDYPKPEEPDKTPFSQKFHPRPAYFTYQKMTETLEGSDWDNIEKISEGVDDIYIYKFTKRYLPYQQVWVLWDDSPDYTQSGYGIAKRIKITGIKHNEVEITEAVPWRISEDTAEFKRWRVITAPTGGIPTNDPEATREVTIELGENHSLSRKTTLPSESL